MSGIWGVIGPRTTKAMLVGDFGAKNEHIRWPQVRIARLMVGSESEASDSDSQSYEGARSLGDIEIGETE